MSAEEVQVEVQGSLREDLIRKAVSFLNNPNVGSFSVDKKEKFLQSKGLTNEEIKLALERSSVQSNILAYGHDLPPKISNPTTVAQVPWIQRIKDIILIVGAAYELYCLYKRYIEPYLFVKRRKPKSIEISISEISENLKKSIEELKGNINQVHSELERVLMSQTEQQNFIRDISQLKSEVATVKGILLSRHQFPSVSLSTTSIPAWQLTGSTHKDDKEILEGEDVEHNSGSSEPEIAPSSNRNGGSQGSDSSLEMIKEVDG